MKIEKQIQDDHQAKLIVEFDTDEIESAKHRAARKIAGKARIPGFRPGKAPYPVIVRQYGEPLILEEAIELIIDDRYSEILDQGDVNPYGPGKLENVSSMDPLTLEILVPLAAEVTLGDYHALKRPYKMPDVTDQEVEEVLTDLRERGAVSEPVDRPAQEGDLVTIKLIAVRKVEVEGKESTLIREHSVPILIKSTLPEDTPEENVRVEWPYAGFSRILLGLSAADEKTLEYTYPDDSNYDHLRGLEAIFHFIVESVKERHLPELNNEFASSLGEYESLEAVTGEIRTLLKSQKEEAYNTEYDNALLDEAASQSEFKYPPQMLEHEIEDMMHGFEERIGQQGMTMDLYLKSRQMDLDAFREETRPSAETRLKKRLVLLQIAEAENVQIEKKELQVETQKTIESLATMMDKKEARKLSGETAYRNVMTNIMADMLTRRAMEHLRGIASGKQSEAQSALEERVDDVTTSEESHPTPPEQFAVNETSGKGVETKEDSQPAVEEQE
ncbi:MAG: trigger factor [Chloroflexi bacterium RBG_16_54_18]|nr:MAG: trigger factor [Chloroflexi bacterium RBG_16_54_18]